jgi:hypothetical protein
LGDMQYDSNNPPRAGILFNDGCSQVAILTADFFIKRVSLRLLLRQPKPIVKFGTLLKIPSGLSGREGNHNRRVCLLAEAIYCSLLGGYLSKVSYAIGDPCPFGFPTSVFNWHGACSHTCLTEEQRDHWTISDAAVDKIIQATSTETLEVSELRVELLRTLKKLASRRLRAKYRESEVNPVFLQPK